MTVLVTGGLGGIGQWVVRGLLARGESVTVLDNRADEQVSATFGAGAEVVVADVTDTPRLKAICREHDITGIAHFASLLAMGCQADPRLATRVNVEGTISVLDAALACGARRVIYASSASVYGPLTGVYGYPIYQPVAETHPRIPWPGVRLYGATKTLAEDMGMHYAETLPLQFVALRFATGMLVPLHDAINRAGVRAHEKLVDTAIAGKPVVIEKGGDEKIDMVYVKDIAHGVHCALMADGDVTGVYNLGSGKMSSLGDLANAVRYWIPDASIEIGRGLDFMSMGPMYGQLDVSHARERLGYVPQFDLVHAIGDYLRESGLTLASQ
jgi:UDP-glucose 4-epimerase